ncbi:MAG: UDP-N-acetylglucosamine 2-epimerase (non-hydrolyzing) [Anaerolineales bacterium]|nr:UDP-N-acetylglucosamine 2-epimerase (non-hydrolyzing) [Anaerolineales bacterium]NUQ84646.1 UDP-N-acetylglucosamine 2-epimerase (non-hydrolyzing) [Anaerolineales bacterium]
MKILSVFGTRPEAVKMAPIVRLLNQTKGIDSRVCVTAQHRQMLDQVLELFQIQPDYDLDLMREGQSLAQLTAGIFLHLDPVLEEVQPDWVLAVGDTTTVVTTCQLAFYRRIKFGHVEAGLRTHNKWHPFPEEINRRLATTMADLHFAPTAWSQGNLLREGVNEKDIVVTGNPVIDALKFVSEQPTPALVIELLERLGVKSDAPKTTRPATKKLILITAHRRENFGQPIENICRALKEIALRGDVEIVYPVHLNPNVQEPVNRILRDVKGITLLPPLDYLPLAHLMKRSSLILTDSGGLQEEAPTFGVPVLVLRETTERPEGIEAGTLKLIGTETSRIVRETNRLLDEESEYAKMAKASNPYGDGHAAERIVEALAARGDSHFQNEK